jgi:hypothetical protein
MAKMKLRVNLTINDTKHCFARNEGNNDSNVWKLKSKLSDFQFNRNFRIAINHFEKVNIKQIDW